eukprot:NODE_471_length_7033_cov_0.382031.p3 type:complete len:242 gc:universal NODE_471_length_7033_cov_0.382031:1965-1240(-)
MEDDWTKHVQNILLELNRNFTSMPRINPQVLFLIKPNSNSDQVITYCKQHNIKLYNHGSVKNPASHFQKEFEELKNMANKLPNIPVDGLEAINKETIKTWFLELFETVYPDCKADMDSCTMFIAELRKEYKTLSFPVCKMINNIMNFERDELKEWIIKPLESEMRFEYVSNYIYNILLLLDKKQISTMSQFDVQLFNSSDNLGDMVIALKPILDKVTLGTVEKWYDTLEFGCKLVLAKTPL